ncbi:MAG: ABC transporter ATP-binding protein [Solirubrobacteraceae bacterium]
MAARSEPPAVRAPSQSATAGARREGPAVAAPPAVELHGLCKSYGSTLALDDVSLRLQPGRFLVLLGPSGSGKSTLIRCLAGIERASAGTIALAGSVVADERRHVSPERRDLTMVFQDFALWPHMSVVQNVAFALRRRRLGRREAGDRALAMLDRVGLRAYAERYPHELSGGEQQRVALARALVARPALLLFDEPLSSLDANLRERLRIEISTLVREHGASAVYITHDQSEAFALGDEVGILQAGRLVQRGAPETIYRAPAIPFVARFTGLAGVLRGRLLGRAEHPLRPGRPSIEPSELVRVLVETTEVGHQLELLATGMAPLAAGSAVQVMLRPTAVRICPADAGAATLRGVVRDGAYHGRGYDYALELGDDLQLTGVFDRRRFARGEVVGLRIDPARALVYAADAAVNAPPLAAGALPRPGPTSEGERVRPESATLRA